MSRRRRSAGVGDVFFQAEDGIRDLVRSRGLGDVYKRQLETDEDERLRQLEQGEKNIEKVKESLSQTNRNLDSKQNEYDLLKSMIDSYEGYPESIRFLSESWQKNPVILGDILEVEEEYKAVIEAYPVSYTHLTLPTSDLV